MSSATANPLDSGDSRYRTNPKTLEDLINPTERQREFLKAIADKDYVLYGGAAGGGKSYILRWWLIIYLIWLFRAKGLRNARVGLFCETYRTLSDRQIVKMRVEIPKWLGELHGDDFRLRPEYGSGEIALRNLDDPSKYYSAEFAAIAVDELTRNPLSVFNDLRFRLRWQHVERPKFAAATNPGGPGHRWVKAYWHDKQFPAELEGKRDQFVMVRALASDNPYIDETYYQSLLTLPPDMARKVAHGDWDVYTGQYFPNFNPAVHVIPHKEALKRIQPWYTRGLSGDWGFEHPHCFHWHAKDERNTVITHHELWDRGVGESEVGRRLTAVEEQYRHWSKLNGFAFSWDAGRLSPRSDKGQPKSITQMIADAVGPRIPKPHPCDSSPGVRLIRARLMSQVIEAGTWLISDACPKLIESIPAMIRDEDHSEEMQKLDWDQATIGDDPVDSAGMGLQWMIGNSLKPWEAQLQDRLTEVRGTFAPGKPDDELLAKFGARKVN